MIIKTSDCTSAAFQNRISGICQSLTCRLRIIRDRRKKIFLAELLAEQGKNVRRSKVIEKLAQSETDGQISMFNNNKYAPKTDNKFFCKSILMRYRPK